MSASGHMYISAGVCRGQRNQNLLELELEIIMSHLIWGLVINPRSFGRTNSICP